MNPVQLPKGFYDSKSTSGIDSRKAWDDAMGTPTDMDLSDEQRSAILRLNEQSVRQTESMRAILRDEVAKHPSVLPPLEVSHADNAQGTQDTALDATGVRKAQRDAGVLRIDQQGQDIRNGYEDGAQAQGPRVITVKASSKGELDKAVKQATRKLHVISRTDRITHEAIIVVE